MTRKIDDNQDKAFTHEPLQSLSSKTTSARITKNEYYLVLASCAYFLCMLAVLVFSGVFIFQKVLAPAISNLADAPVENKEDTNLSTTIISDEDSMILLYV